MDKITIERETLERAITALTYHQNQTRPIERTRIALDALRAALAAQPAETQPVAKVASKHGDPERFGEREIRVLADLRKIPYGTKLYAAQPAPAAVPPGYVLVPIEPTPEMVDAGDVARHSVVTQARTSVIYRAMIAAAGDKP